MTRPRAWNSSLPAPSKPMKRGPGPKRGKRLNRTGKRAKRLRKEGLIDPALRDYASDSPCALTCKAPPSDVHHIREDGETKVDWRDGECRVLPLNHRVHMDWHGLSEAKWEAKYGFARPTKGELGALAREFGQRFRQEAA